MDEKILETFIAQYIYSSTEPAALFTWHGGEPILRGMEFFEKVIALQNKYAEGKAIENSLQTNGTTLTEDWCRFFRDHHFLIGLSIDDRSIATTITGSIRAACQVSQRQCRGWSC